MERLTGELAEPRRAAALIAALAVATIGAALVFQHGFGYLPCPLCLWQRWPYYVAIPIAALAATGLGGSPATRAALGLLAIVFAFSAGLGIYHSGVEWGYWLGPSGCGAVGAGGPAGSMDDFLSRLETTRVISCTEAAWRFLGVSMAGWNALISAFLAALALFAALARRRGGVPQGSSSVSQYR